MKINGMEKKSTLPSLKIVEKASNFINSNEAFFFFYDKIVTFLGLFSVLFSLIFITLVIAIDPFLGFFLPSIDGLMDFLVLTASIAFAIMIHELSHIVILVNRSIRVKSAGLSIKGIVGGYVQADVDQETYARIVRPFFSSGLGSNMLFFLIFAIFSTLYTLLWIPAAVNLWFAVLNSIPAPLMDGGKIFEIYLEKIKNKTIVDILPPLILVLWFIIFIVKFIIM